MHTRILHESWEAPYHKEHPLYAHLLYKFLNYLYESHFPLKYYTVTLLRIAGFVLKILFYFIFLSKDGKKSFLRQFICYFHILAYRNTARMRSAIWYSEEVPLCNDFLDHNATISFRIRPVLKTIQNEYFSTHALLLFHAFLFHLLVICLPSCSVPFS